MNQGLMGFPKAAGRGRVLRSSLLTADLPPASRYLDSVVWTSDGDDGSAAAVISNGTNWIVITTGEIASGLLPDPELISTGGTPSASTSSGSNDATKAFDGDISGTSGWVSTSAGLPQWLKYDFGTAKTPTRYKLMKQQTSSDAGSQPTEWTFEGSNDDAAWTTLDTQTGQDLPEGLTFGTYDFANTTAYRYVRLTVTAVNLNTNVILVEAEIWGVP